MQNVQRSRSFDIDSAMIVMVGTVLLGVIFGTVSYLYMPSRLSQLLFDANTGYIGSRAGETLSRILLDSFAVSSLFIGAEFILGFFALGQLPELLILIMRGMGLGTVLSQVYNSYSGLNLLCAVFLIVPSAVISVYALAACAKNSVRLSTRLLLIALSSERCKGLLDNVRTYSARFVILEAAALGAALTDCFCSVCFAARIQ